MAHNKSYFYLLLLILLIITLLVPECEGGWGHKKKKKRRNRKKNSRKARAARRRRRRRRYKRKARAFALVTNKLRRRRRRRRRHWFCSKRNCYIIKQQNKLQNMMSDLIFHSIAMSPPIDITEPKYKVGMTRIEKQMAGFPAFIQGDVGRLRRRNMAMDMDIHTNKYKVLFHENEYNKLDHDLDDETAETQTESMVIGDMKNINVENNIKEINDVVHETNSTYIGYINSMIWIVCVASIVFIGVCYFHGLRYVAQYKETDMSITHV